MPNTELATTEIIEINPPQDLQKPQPSELQPSAQPQPQTKRFLCRHIFTDGRRCGSPSLRSQNFCYYHYCHRTPLLAGERKRRRKVGFDLTRLDGLDNPTAIQLSLSEVLGRLARETIDPKRAGLMLYGLQIASRNLRRGNSADISQIPDDIVEDAELGQLSHLEEDRTIPPSLLSEMRAYLRQPGSTNEGFEKHFAEPEHYDEVQT